MNIKNYDRIDKYLTSITDLRYYIDFSNLSIISGDTMSRYTMRNWLTYKGEELIKSARELAMLQPVGSGRRNIEDYKNFIWAQIRDYGALIDYLFSYGEKKFDEEAFWNELERLSNNIGEEVYKYDFSSHFLDDPSRIIYDPIMQKIINKVLKGEILQKYNNLVDEYNKEVSEYYKQKKLDEKKDKINRIIENAVSKISSDVKKMGRYRFLKYDEYSDDLNNILKFFESIDVMDIINGNIKQSYLDDYKNALKIFRKYCGIMNFTWKLQEFVDDKVLEEAFENIFGMSIFAYENRLEEQKNVTDEQSAIIAVENPKDVVSEDDKFVDRTEKENAEVIDVQKEGNSGAKALDEFKQARTEQKKEDNKKRKFILFGVIEKDGVEQIVPLDLEDYEVRRIK